MDLHIQQKRIYLQIDVFSGFWGLGSMDSSFTLWQQMILALEYRIVLIDHIFFVCFEPRFRNETSAGK